MSGPYEFRKPEKNVARDTMLSVLKHGPLSTGDLLLIGKRHGLFEGETQGMIQTLAKHGDIQRREHGWWTLPTFTPESVGEIENIGPRTTRVGDEIVHKGIKYRRETKVKGDTPLGRIRELMKQLDHWESQGHKSAGTDYLQRHFKEFQA